MVRRPRDFTRFILLSANQVWEGTFSYCSDPVMAEANEVDVYHVYLTDGNGISGQTECEAAGYDWKNADWNFDNFGHALHSVLIIFSFNGWQEILFAAVNARYGGTMSHYDTGSSDPTENERAALCGVFNAGFKACTFTLLRAPSIPDQYTCIQVYPRNILRKTVTIIISLRVVDAEKWHHRRDKEANYGMQSLLRYLTIWSGQTPRDPTRREIEILSLPF